MKSPPEAAQDRSGERVPLPPSRTRVAPAHDQGQGRIAAVAAVGATGLALALARARPRRPPNRPGSMTAGNVQSLSRADAATAAHFFNTPRPTAPGPAW